MTEFLITLDIMMPILLLLALGWVLRRVGWLKAQTASEVTSLIFKLFLPALLFNNVRGLTLSEISDWKFLIFMFISIMTIFLLSMVLVKRFEPHVRKRGAMAQGIFRTNFAILGIPLMEAMFGKAGIAMVSLALPLVIPMMNILAVVALSSPTGQKVDVKQILKKIVTNPLIIACCLGLVAFLFNIRLPKVVDKLCTQVGSIATPLSLLVLGASLQWQGVKDNRKELICTVVLKQAIIPALMVALGILCGFRNETLGVILVFFSAPCAVSSYPMAQAMGSDGDLAASQVVLTTVFSMGTLFALIYLCKVLGVM